MALKGLVQPEQNVLKLTFTFRPQQYIPLVTMINDNIDISGVKCSYMGSAVVYWLAVLPYSIGGPRVELRPGICIGTYMFPVLEWVYSGRLDFLPHFQSHD